ncbi:tetratricopeptide repeat protein [Cardiobacteriaceae bacterium TAE3-ERU3]|nr:tetratricopeptide repeat protein [Cardiobacteriaceae bacterium TAE3-ERU3]
MKKLWPSVACSAVLLSGCMYGSATAPITALNSNHYQPSRAPVGQIHMTRGQAVAPTPARVAQPVAPQQPVRVAPQQPQQSIEVAAQSPYSQPATVQAASAQPNDDGWSVAPQVTQDNASAEQVNNAQGQQLNQQNSNQAQPVRPVETRPTNTNIAANTATPAPVTNSNDATNDSQAANQSQQVASATPPQRPAAPAEGETPVKALIKKAHAALNKDDRDGAVAYLENAQRIAPQDARILYDIANIRYHQGRYKDAETFAGRAVQVGGDNNIMKKSWALVANARKSLGDNQGAIAAAEKAASLGN